jgi:peptidoglycan/xylan/chitin deacetylase (PgdA/CDA1 family)
MAFSLPILTFHCLDERPSVISFSPQLFRRGMARLYESGYRTLSLLEAVKCLREKASPPQRSFVITFDDGYQSVHEQAFPLLQRYGFSATVFLTVGTTAKGTQARRLPSIGGRSMLSWAEIHEMYRRGITFGAHTLTHPDLTRLPSERIEAEVCNSKAIIEDVLGTHVDSFAYPFGRYDKRSREIVRQHFTCACSDKLGHAHSSSDPFALERIDAYYLRSDRLLELMPTLFFPWYIRARNLPRQIRRSIQFS